MFSYDDQFASFTSNVVCALAREILLSGGPPLGWWDQ